MHTAQGLEAIFITFSHFLRAQGYFDRLNHSECLRCSDGGKYDDSGKHGNSGNATRAADHRHRV